MQVKMAMHQEVLFSYRIRGKSTTGQRRYLQALTLNYLREAFRKEYKTRTELPFPDAYAAYLRRHGYHRCRSQNRFDKATYLLQNSWKSSPQKDSVFRLRQLFCPASTAEIFSIRFKQRG